jgi:hypothetical protein
VIAPNIAAANTFRVFISASLSLFAVVTDDDLLNKFVDVGGI